MNDFFYPYVVHLLYLQIALIKKAGYQPWFGYEWSFLTLKWTSFLCFFKSAAVGKVFLHRWQEFLMLGFWGFTMAFDFEDTPFKGCLSSLILGDMLIARKSKCFWSMFCYLFFWASFIWQLFMTTNKVPPTCNWFKESLDALL